MLSHDEAVAQPGGSSLATGWAVPSPKKRPRESRNAGAAGEAEMGSVNPPKKRDYGRKTRIDLNQSYQVAYWKERLGVSE